MKKALLVAAILVAPAFFSAAAASDTADAGAEPAKEKMICRADKATGSRVRVNRVCLTKTQWDELALKKKRSMDEMNRSGSVGRAEGIAPGFPM